MSGTIRPPGDKSITHRTLILASLARSTSRIAGALTSADAKSTARVLRQLGCEVGPLEIDRVLEVRGTSWSEPASVLNCGNSGTTARLMLGALAGHHFSARITGDASLRRRPMRRVTDPLVAMGATVSEQGSDGLPLVIRGGNLRSIVYETPVASAQVKSAILLAGLVGGVPVTVVEPARSRDHTERLLQFLGCDLRVRGTEVSLVGAPEGWPRVGDLDLAVPGDASSSAFLVGAALLAGKGELLIAGVGVNPTRIGYLAVLQRMGGRIELLDPREVAGEPVADLLVRPQPLIGTEVVAGEIPSLIDEIPLLAVLAARASGETTFRSVGELRVKESDRLALIAQNLRTVGATAEVQGENLVVVGSDRPLRGLVDTAGDHRLTMSFAVLGTAIGCDIELSEVESAGISYPRFFADLRQAAGNAQ
ncbi:MAG: 3-phosphoshikimate 1-carboxyvinyltransferase [Gemmatimonadales bacterium]